MILTRKLTEKLLINELNSLSLKYPHFKDNLALAKDNCRVQLDLLYSNYPTDSQVYHFLLEHNYNLAKLAKHLSYNDYRKLKQELNSTS